MLYMFCHSKEKNEKQCRMPRWIRLSSVQWMVFYYKNVSNIVCTILTLQKLLTFIWPSSFTGCPVSYWNGGRKDGQTNEVTPGSFLRIVLLLLLLSLVSFIWLNIGSARQQANQDVRFCFCFKNYNLLNKNITETLMGGFGYLAISKTGGSVWSLF